MTMFYKGIELLPIGHVTILRLLFACIFAREFQQIHLIDTTKYFWRIQRAAIACYAIFYKAVYEISVYFLSEHISASFQNDNSSVETSDISPVIWNTFNMFCGFFIPLCFNFLWILTAVLTFQQLFTKNGLIFDCVKELGILVAYTLFFCLESAHSQRTNQFAREFLKNLWSYFGNYEREFFEN